LDLNRPGLEFCLTMDNLNIHKHPAVLDLIDDAGHKIVFRAPYWSCDGAIEYVFNTIHVKLQMADNGVIVASTDSLCNCENFSVRVGVGEVFWRPMTADNSVEVTFR